MITLIFNVLYFLKMCPNFNVWYQIKPNCYNIFMAIFIDLWSCLFTTKLSYAQLFKWGHSSARAVSWKNATVLQIKIWNSFCVHMAIVNQSGFFPKWMAFFQRWTVAAKWLVALRACSNLFYEMEKSWIEWLSGALYFKGQF